MKYFPIFLDLERRPVVLVGGGEEILRKARLFAKANTRLAVIAPALCDELAAMPQVDWLARHFAPELLAGAALVCAAHADWNEAAAQAAPARGIPVNVVDRPELSTFLVPSIVDRDPGIVAIGTEGAAPVLAQGLRARIDALLPQGLGALAKAAAALRPTVATRLPAGAGRRGFWQRFFFGDLRQAHLAGETARFDLLLARLLSRHTPPPEGRVSFLALASDDPELLTLKGQRKLQEADLIVAGADVPSAILELARRDATRQTATGNFVADTATLHAAALAGRQVVRLVRGAIPAEELANLAAEGVAVEAIAAAGLPPSAQILSFPKHLDGETIILRAAS
jgi:uroporphyrin-III C-methyltransferase/precorrin-2 dehydrogenase/sirohydrochlorin ferrochelatase